MSTIDAKHAIIRNMVAQTPVFPGSEATDTGDPIAKDGAYWPWIKNGDGVGAMPLTGIPDEETSAALTELIREGKVRVIVRKDDMDVQFALA